MREVILIGSVAMLMTGFLAPFPSSPGYGVAEVGPPREYYGDEPYYGKLVFRRIPFGQITLPGPADPNRLLAAELAPDAMVTYTGAVAADPAQRL